MADVAGPEHRGDGRVAIIGGSAEAQELALRLGRDTRLWQSARNRRSGQGVPRSIDLRSMAAGASALVIAPHPCDLDSLRLGLRLAEETGLPHVTLARPEWQADRRDRWITVRSVQQAAEVIAPATRVLVTLGRPALGQLRALRQAHLLVRQLTRHDDPFPMRHGRYLHGDAPFSVPDEVAMMRRVRIDTVLTCNAGGTGGWPKVAAARRLGLPVVMVARPRITSGPVVRSVAAAIQWLEARTWLDA